MNFFTPLRPLLKGWLLSFLGFGFIAFVISVQFISAEHAGLNVALRSSLRDFLPWAIFTPLLFRLAARYPIGRTERGSHLAIHLVSCIAALILCHWWTGILDPGFRAGLGGPHPRGDRPPGREFAGDDAMGPHPPPPPANFDRRPPPPRGPRHRLDLVHIGTFQLPLYLMILCAAHAAFYYGREREHVATLARVKLDALRSKLQPHFLFNTLNTIAGLVHEDPDRADALVVALSDLLRLTLETSDELKVRFEREVEVLERYLAIMHARFETRLDYKFEVEPETLSALVPPLLLQPLVENAVCHGIDPKPDGGTVAIFALRQGNKLLLKVHDNGVGHLDLKNAHEGVGLSIVRERLRALYGNAATFDLRNSNGVTAEISLPFESAG